MTLKGKLADRLEDIVDSKGGYCDGDFDGFAQQIIDIFEEHNTVTIMYCWGDADPEKPYKCTNTDCNKIVYDDALYCKHCGAKIDWREE